LGIVPDASPRRRQFLQLVESLAAAEDDRRAVGVEKGAPGGFVAILPAGVTN
jgi:hypothetical protein